MEWLFWALMLGMFAIIAGLIIHGEIQFRKEEGFNKLQNRHYPHVKVRQIGKVKPYKDKK